MVLEMSEAKPRLDFDDGTHGKIQKIGGARAICIF